MRRSKVAWSPSMCGEQMGRSLPRSCRRFRSSAISICVAPGVRELARAEGGGLCGGELFVDARAEANDVSSAVPDVDESGLEADGGFGELVLA